MGTRLAPLAVVGVGRRGRQFTKPAQETIQANKAMAMMESSMIIQRRLQRMWFVVSIVLVVVGVVISESSSSRLVNASKCCGG